MMTTLETEIDFLYTYAISDRKHLRELLESASERQIKALAESIININLFTSCKTLLKSCELLLKTVVKYNNNWKTVFIIYPERVRRIVARVVRMILLAEIVLLLCVCDEAVSRN